MRTLIIKLLIIGLACNCMVGCKKDEIKTYMKSGSASTISLSSSTLLLSSVTGSDTVETISWTKAEFGFSAAINYTVQVAKSGTNFNDIKEYNTGSETELKFTGSELNQLAILRGLTPGSAGQLDIRIKSSVSDSVAIYSDKSTVTITPYLVIIDYPSMWVPGDYQGWNPSAAPKISSRSGNGVYEGYVDITAGTLQFKYTSDPDWSHTNYGTAGSTVSGSDVFGALSTSNSAGNLFVPAPGYYLLKANTNTSSWSGTLINSWSLIGTFNNWNSDADMTYNPSTKQWTATVNFASETQFKFRANHAWDINLGDEGADLILDYGGANISATGGSHIITLDLTKPGNYTYKVQ